MNIRSWFGREQRIQGKGATRELPTTFPEVAALVEDEGMRTALSTLHGELETNYATLDSDFNELLTDYNSSLDELRMIKESLSEGEAATIAATQQTAQELDSNQEENMSEQLRLDGDNYVEHLKNKRG